MLIEYWGGRTWFGLRSNVTSQYGVRTVPCSRNRSSVSGQGVTPVHSIYKYSCNLYCFHLRISSPRVLNISVAPYQHESSDWPSHFAAFTCSRDFPTNNNYGVMISDDSPLSPVSRNSRVRTGSIYIYIYIYMGYAVAQLVEALRYKSEGRGFDSRWCHWDFSFT